MPTSYSLGGHYEDFVKSQLASGRYNNASEVVRDALRMLEEREKRLSLLDTALERGMADLQDGKVKPAEDVLDRLSAKYAQMAKAREAL